MRQAARSNQFTVAHIRDEECGLLFVQVSDVAALNSPGSFKGCDFKSDPSECLEVGSVLRGVHLDHHVTPPVRVVGPLDRDPVPRLCLATVHRCRLLDM